MLRWRLKRIAQSAAISFLVLFAVLLVRTVGLTSLQPAAAPLADAPVAEAKVVAIVADAVRVRTISESPAAPAPAAELETLHGILGAAFPKVHATLARELASGHSLLYTWKGTGAEAPIILCAHQDVVPVEPGTEGAWSHPPFSGDVDDRFVWGRGTLDDKGSLVTILSAVEALLESGFAPQRTVYLAFGRDEEVAGSGARAIADLLASRGVHAEAAFDEGNPIVQGIVPSIPGPVAPIGVAEKGYLTLELSVDLAGGHSSTPRRDTAYGVLSQGLARLLAEPMPARRGGATTEFFAWAAPEMTFGQRFVLGNTWLTWPIVTRVFASSPALDASIRTTTAVTVVHAGVKDNVVPRTAKAEVNFRVLPGDTTDEVIAHVRGLVDDRVKVTPVAASRSEPTRISKSEGRAFTAMAATVREVFPGTVVAPALFLGASDGRKYDAVADDVYRLLPVVLAESDVARVHGTDERIAKSALVGAVRFYRRLIVRLTGAPP